MCYAKKGGCGAKFADNAPEIVNQETGVVKNPDIADLANTILKMADKRALIAATLIATGMSEYFTQDVEDFIDASYVEPSREMTPVEARNVSIKVQGGEKLMGELNVEQLRYVIENSQNQQNVEAAKVVLKNDFNMEIE